MNWLSPEDRVKLGQARRKEIARQQMRRIQSKDRLTPALNLIKRFRQGACAGAGQDQV